MEKSSGLHVLYKNLGESPLDTISRFKKDNPEYEKVSMTYAGRLDPMAEGVLLVLSSEEIKEKDKYLNLKKTYETEALWGFSTDTFDLLGKVQNTHKNYVPKESEVLEYLKKSIGKFVQKYPAFSSKPVGGVPLFHLAREGKLEGKEIPTHEVEIFEADFISRRKISKKDLLGLIISKIEKVSGDFRQEEILDKWKEVFEKIDDSDFIVDKISLRVSSGFYVRQFISDFGDEFNTTATTFHIKRTIIGEYRLGLD